MFTSKAAVLAHLIRILGAANFDTGFLNNIPAVGKFLKAGDPHCALDFNYDTEWFIVVISPFVLLLLLLVCVALRLLLACLCNAWLPPIYKRDLYIPIPFVRHDEPYVVFERLGDSDDSKEQPLLKTGIITILLLPVLIIPLVAWWILWGVKMFLVKMFILCDGSRGPVCTVHT